MGNLITVYVRIRLNFIVLFIQLKYYHRVFQWDKITYIKLGIVQGLLCVWKYLGLRYINSCRVKYSLFTPFLKIHTHLSCFIVTRFIGIDRTLLSSCLTNYTFWISDFNFQDSKVESTTIKHSCKHKNSRNIIYCIL